MTYKYAKPTFIALYDNNRLIGVNSGHPTGKSYRSRGLYVFNEFRGKGLGILLLQETINCARQLGYSSIWSMPRQDSISTYNNAGFIQSSSWFGTETSTSNCFVIKDLNSDK
jgi:GNAT superfamily N-acetyltransferase